MGAEEHAQKAKNDPDNHGKTAKNNNPTSYLFAGRRVSI